MVDDMIIEVWMFNSTGRWPQTVTAGEGEGEEEGREKGGKEKNEERKGRGMPLGEGRRKCELIGAKAPL